jgi:hypothetical protein
LPPKDYFKRLVSFESLYGMWPAAPFLLFAPSAKEVITCLRQKRDLFISIASLAACPVVPV